MIPLHIALSTLAWAELFVTATLALIMASQHWLLRHHRGQALLLNRLPALQTTETWLFRLLIVGWILLSAVLLSVLGVIEHWFTPSLVGKTLLSLIAWLVLTTLLGGRYWLGWRGSTAVNWTLTGFAVLLLAYFGNKLVIASLLT